MQVVGQAVIDSFYAFRSEGSRHSLPRPAVVANTTVQQRRSFQDRTKASTPHGIVTDRHLLKAMAQRGH